MVVGEEVTKLKVGDRVVSLTHPTFGHCSVCSHGNDNLCIDSKLPGHRVFGGSADLVARNESEVLHEAEGVSSSKLGSCLRTNATTWRVAFSRTPVKSGSFLLVTGTDGSLASGAVQIAKFTVAATVIGSTSDLHEKDMLLNLGFDNVVDNKGPARLGAISQFANGVGVDMAQDFVGTQRMVYFAKRNIWLGGTIVPVGAQRSSKVEDSSVLGNLYNVLGMEMSVFEVRVASQQDPINFIKMSSHLFRPCLVGTNICYGFTIPGLRRIRDGLFADSF